MFQQFRPFVRTFLPTLCLMTVSAVAAHADTTTTVNTDPNAPTSNFSSPGNSNAIGYTVMTGDSGGFLRVTLTSFAPVSTSSLFANLYFETDGSTTVNSGSQLGFEFGTSPNDAFIPGVTGSNKSVAGQGLTEVVSTNSSGNTVFALAIPNSFFETDPLNMGFPKTPSGGFVSLHLSQSFGYSVAGGGNYYAFPSELGSANLNDASPTPEPSSLLLLATGSLSALGMARRRFRRS